METKAEYQISTSVHEGILEIVVTGEVADDAVNKLMNEGIAIIRSMNASALIVDFRALKRHFGYVEAYQNLRRLPDDIRRVNTALLDIQENAAFASFFETTARNASIPLKWFTDIDSARAWLKGRQEVGSRSARDSGQDEKGR